MSDEIGQLLFLIDTAYDHVSWHGTNLRGSIRGLTPTQAAWRPAPGRHNIWELIVHAAYWKYVARFRMTRDESRPTFPLGGHNWYARPIRPEVAPQIGENPPVLPEHMAVPRTTRLQVERMLVQQLRSDVALLDSEHRSLIEFVRAIPPSVLHKKIGKTQHTHLSTIAGVAAHDVYHAAQIQLLKTLLRLNTRTPPR
jgi:hypothetical protein